MTMKLVTYDLHEASTGRRIELDRALMKMRFRAILETVWVAKTDFTEDQILRAMRLLDEDKAIVIELDEILPLAEQGVVTDGKGVAKLQTIYDRMNQKISSKAGDLLRVGA